MDFVIDPSVGAVISNLHTHGTDREAASRYRAARERAVPCGRLHLS